jgi:hypothetical protein
MKIDLFVRAVHEPEKNIKKKKNGTTTLYFTYMRGGTPKDGELKLDTFVEPMDIINIPIFISF